MTTGGPPRIPPSDHPQDVLIDEWPLWERLFRETCSQSRLPEHRKRPVSEGTKHVLVKVKQKRKFLRRAHWAWQCHFCDLKQPTPYPPGSGYPG